MTETRIPVVEERARIEKEVIERGIVRIETFVKERVETIFETLTREDVHIRHVRMDVTVDAMPEVRQEGDVVIIPVVEERIVVSKRLVLTEELHVHRRKVSEHASIPVTLQSTGIAVQRQRPSEDGPISESPIDSESL